MGTHEYEDVRLDLKSGKEVRTQCRTLRRTAPPIQVVIGDKPNETLQSIFPRGVPNDCPALSVDDINKLMQWTKEEDFKHPERVGKVFALIPWILANNDNVKLMSGKGQHQMRTYFLEKLGAMGSYDEKQEPLRVLCPAKRWRNEGQFLDAVRENPDEKELGEEFAAEEAEKRAEAKKRAQELAQQEAQEE